jgi:SAM-dependent methyltransferase
MDERAKEAASRHWDSVKPDVVPRRYWLFDDCIRAINRRMGIDSPIWMAGLIDRLRERLNGHRLDRGISIGCGAGGKEMQLIKHGIVDGFDLFEISKARIEQGQELFRRNGLAEKVTFRADDGLAAMQQGAAYDLVHWDSALHHMDDTRHALELSLNALKPGGYLVINEYVGNNRFQWPDEQLALIDKFRATLPDRFFAREAGARFPASRLCRRPTVEDMIRIDPSEAPDSENILPAIQDLLPGADLWLLGGVIYHIGLNDVIANFRLPEDKPLLDIAMLLDEALSMAGHNHFAVCIYRKPD